jgi:hypothetical protein
MAELSGCSGNPHFAFGLQTGDPLSDTGTPFALKRVPAGLPEEDIGAREQAEAAAIDSICAPRRSKAPKAFAQEDIGAGEKNEESQEVDDAIDSSKDPSPDE